MNEAIWQDKHDNNFTDLACRDTHEAGFFGYLGEIVYADFYGVSRPRLLKGKVDKGVDFIVDGKRVQVKTTPKKQPPYYLTLFPWKLKYEVDYYALIHLDLSAMTATIIAEVPYAEFKEKCFKHDHGHGERLVMRFE